MRLEPWLPPPAPRGNCLRLRVLGDVNRHNIAYDAIRLERKRIDNAPRTKIPTLGKRVQGRVTRIVRAIQRQSILYAIHTAQACSILGVGKENSCCCAAGMTTKNKSLEGLHTTQGGYIAAEVMGIVRWQCYFALRYQRKCTPPWAGFSLNRRI